MVDLLRVPLLNIPHSDFGSAHPELIQDVATMAQQMGIKPPEIKIAKSRLANALSIPAEHSVYITQGFLDAFHMKDLNAKLPKPLKMMLAHEMSHLRDGAQFYEFAQLHIPYILMPLAAMGAVGLYHHLRDPAVNDVAKQSKEELHQSLTTARGVEEAQLLAQYDALKEKHPAEDYAKKCEQAYAVQQRWWRAAEYVAAGALGLTAGHYTGRQMVLSAEFRADRAAIEAGGTAQEWYETLHHITEKNAQILKDRHMISLEDFPFFSRIKDYVRTEAMLLHNNMADAHPDNIQRFTQALAHERAVSSAALTQHGI